MDLNAKILVGKTLHWAFDTVFSSPHFPLFPRFANGISWQYDIARFSGTRNLKMFFDVGANLGQTSEQILKYFRYSDIHAFEPVQNTYVKLASRMKNVPNLRAHRLAMGSNPGRKTINLQSDSQFNSLRYSSEKGPLATEAKETIDVSTVELFAGSRNIASIDLLKIDAQGSDLDVIRGADVLLRTHRIRFVMCEVGFQPDDQVNQPFLPVHEHLWSRGLRLCGFYGGGSIGPRWSYVCHRDALYIDPYFSES